jgi:hypothetical protein
MRAHLLEPPLPFEKSDPGRKVPDDVRDLVMRALTKRREDRYATADEFDTEIIKVARRYLKISGTYNAADLVASAKRVRHESSDEVTPSAQKHLDEKFMASRTPTPAGSLSTGPKVIGPAAQHEATSKIVESKELPKVRDVQGEAEKKANLALPLLAGAVVVLGVGFFLRHGEARARARGSVAATPCPGSGPRGGAGLDGAGRDGSLAVTAVRGTSPQPPSRSEAQVVPIPREDAGRARAREQERAEGAATSWNGAGEEREGPAAHGGKQ